MRNWYLIVALMLALGSVVACDKDGGDEGENESAESTEEGEGEAAAVDYSDSPLIGSWVHSAYTGMTFAFVADGTLHTGAMGTECDGTWEMREAGLWINYAAGQDGCISLPTAQPIVFSNEDNTFVMMDQTYNRQ